VPCYYSGSIDRLNLGERNDEKSILLVDVPDWGLATVTPLQLEPTPFHDLRVPAADLETLPQRYPDLDHAFVRVHLECQAGDDPVVLQRRVRELCPRCLEVQFSGHETSSAISDQHAQPRDFAGTVFTYLRELYHEDPDLPELERRTNELLREVSDASATD
jgi:hypothetical protein